MKSAICRWLAGKTRTRQYRLQDALSLAAVAAVAVSLASCASMQNAKDMTPEAKQALVTERINARWAALMKGDLEGAYTYMSAGSQEAVPFKVYKAKIKPGMWRGIKIDEMDCETEICQVKLTLTYDHQRMKGIQTPFEETWIIEKGNAWYVYRDRE